MSMNAVKQPHDGLFRWIFSQREHATGLLKAALPSKLTALVEWGTLQLVEGSFVDPALRHRHSDLVFSARLRGKELVFYALLEHQRDVEALMVFRMSVYMTRLWEQLVRDRPAMRKLPPIIPILIHHSDTGWTAATSFEDIIEAEGMMRETLHPYIPRFDLCLIDLSAGRADKLVHEMLTALGRLALWCLSVAGDDARLEREIERFKDALDDLLEAKHGLAALEVLLSYLLSTHPQVGVDKIGKLLTKTSGSQAQEAIVTVLDEIERRGEERGEQRGKREGKREGRAQALLDLLAARFGRVPAKASSRIMTADEAVLAQWTLRVLTASTLEDVLDGERERPTTARRPPARKRAPRG